MYPHLVAKGNVVEKRGDVIGQEMYRGMRMRMRANVIENEDDELIHNLHVANLLQLLTTVLHPEGQRPGQENVIRQENENGIED